MSSNDEFDALLSASSHHLTLGEFEEGLQVLARASALAQSPSERASVACLHIQLLVETGAVSEALDLADAATSDQRHTALTHDLALVAASLALHTDARRAAERILQTWLEMRLAQDGTPGGEISERDAQVMRLYVVRILKVDYGVDRALEVLESASTFLLAESCAQIRSELVDDDAAIATEINSPSSIRLSRRVPDQNIALVPPRSTVSMVRQFAERLRAWMRDRSDDEKRAAFIAALGVFLVWSLARARGQRQSVLGILKTSFVQSLRVAFGLS
jgi:hypothetical protein